MKLEEIMVSPPDDTFDELDNPVVGSYSSGEISKMIGEMAERMKRRVVTEEHKQKTSKSMKKLISV